MNKVCKHYLFKYSVYILIVCLLMPLCLFGYDLYSTTLTEIRMVENRHVMHVMKTTEKVLYGTSTELLEVVDHTSHSDEYRLAVETKERAWIEQNVNNRLAEFQNIHFIATVDLQGNIIAEKGDMKTFMKPLQEQQNWKQLQKRERFSGLMGTEEGLVAIAGSKIKDINSKSEPTGLFIIGRTLDNGTLLDIQKTLGSYIHIVPSSQRLSVVQNTDSSFKQNLHANSHNNNDTPLHQTAYDRDMTKQVKDIFNQPIGTIYLEKNTKSADSILPKLIYFCLIAIFIMLVVLGIMYLSFRHKQNLLHSINENLLNTSTTDELTGLLNRRGFLSCLDNIIKEDRKNGYVLFIDLDNFKGINDTFGHHMGDLLLQAVSDRLRKAAESATICRLGGDEFTVVLSGITKEEVLHIAEQIREGLSKPFLIEGSCLNITASIGISSYPEDGYDTETIIRNADMAMYQSKKHKNCHHFFTSEVKSNLS